MDEATAYQEPPGVGAQASWLNQHQSGAARPARDLSEGNLPPWLHDGQPSSAAPQPANGRMPVQQWDNQQWDGQQDWDQDEYAHQRRGQPQGYPQQDGYGQYGQYADQYDQQYAQDQYAQDQYAQDQYAQDQYAQDQYAQYEDGSYDPAGYDAYDDRGERAAPQEEPRGGWRRLFRRN
jgi:hypothetical protein